MNPMGILELKNPKYFKTCKINFKQQNEEYRKESVEQKR